MFTPKLANAILANGRGLFTFVSLSLVALALSVVQPAATTITVNSTADTVNPSDGLCTLREAIRAANSDTASGAVTGECPAGSGADIITFSVTGAIVSVGGTFQINADLMILGPGARNLAINGNGGRVFKVNDGVTLDLRDVTITNGGSGGSTSVSFGGGAIWNDRGTLSVTDVTFFANYSCSPVPVCGSGSGHGGAIANGGTLTVRNSTFVNNASQEHGGAIFNFGGTDDAGIVYNGSAVIVNSTIFNNTARENRGGGIANRDGLLTVINSTIAGNHADNLTGGGIDNTTGGEVTLRNTIVANNTALIGANCRNGGTLGDGGGNLDSGASCGFTAPTSKSNANANLGPLQNNGGPTDTMALQPGSAAIDMGVDSICAAPPVNNLDQRGVTRPQGPRCDIGAVEGGPAQADLSIIKDNLLNAVVAGQLAPYSISVHNGGTSTVVNAIVTDTFPPNYIVIDWDCRTTPGSVCEVPVGTGNIIALVTLAPDGSAFFTVRGRVDPNATGTLSNTACVAAPPGVIDPNPDNNCSTDEDEIRAPTQLIVIKDVINDNGGTAVAADFTMTVTGNSPTPASFPGAEAPGTVVTLNAGSYSVSESGPSGYAMTFSADCSGTIALGETKTCTVTNDDIQPKLIVIKDVVNDNGGTAVAADFTMTVTGNNPTPASFPGAEAPGTVVTLNAGSYSVAESGPSGYTASFSADCAGTIAVGDTKTCTVTNDDVQPKLIVIKDVVNNNGGTAVAADFTMTVTGNSPTPASFPGAEAPGTVVTLNAGSYSVSESGPSGYTASFSADCAGTIALGETRTCTVTNDDRAATLIVIKHVINDNGGTATAADFTLDSGGANDTPDDFAGAEAPGTVVTLNPGSYSVSEGGPSGYTASFSADCAGMIALGETKTCTVTNDDVQPTLIVIKDVVNNNGGTAVAADFTMTVTGNSPTPASFPGAEAPGTVVTLNAGSYSVSESGPSGYVASFDGCSGTIALGETKTCTVTNDDIQPPPDLVIVKSDGQDTVQAGDTLTYTLTISNVGGQAATGVSVTDTLPALTTFIAASNGGSESGGLVTWPAFDLAAGASVTRTVTVRVNDSTSAPERDTRSWADPSDGDPDITFSTPEHYSGCRSATITNIATVTDDGAHGPDPTPDNNTASDTDRVIAFDVIWTTGVPDDWTLKGWVRVEYVVDTQRILIREYEINQTGDLDLRLTYPPVGEWPVMSNGVAEIHVDLAIEVYDDKGQLARWVGDDRRRAPGTLGPGQDWDVWCRITN